MEIIFVMLQPLLHQGGIILYGPPLSSTAKKLMLLGAGELGKEVAIEAQRLGIEVIAVDRYDQAPAMQVAHRAYTINMLEAPLLRQVIEQEQPDLIVPEIEAINTPTLIELEQEGFHVIPTARAAWLTMDREGIRRLAAEELRVPTAKYLFAETFEEFQQAAKLLGYPLVVKPIMSSSGKGQSICQNESELEDAWNYAQTGGRAALQKVIVEEWVPFDFEITLLTVRSSSGTTFCDPIGHVQKNGDYIESWQPHPMTNTQLAEAQMIAKKVTDALGGYGIFGVELFVTKDAVLFSEVSPRPHDTGLVTLITQDLSEFALHVRAILGFPIPAIRRLRYGASRAIKATDEMNLYQISGVKQALSVPDTQIRIFGKPVTKSGRRMAVILAAGDNISDARDHASQAASYIQITSNFKIK